MAKKKGATGRILHDPIEDRLTPIFPLDLSRMRTDRRSGSRHGPDRFHRAARSAMPPTCSKPWPAIKIVSS